MTVSMKPLPFNAFNREERHRRTSASKLKQFHFDENSEPMTSLEKMGLKMQLVNVLLEGDTVSLGGLSVDF